MKIAEVLEGERLYGPSVGGIIFTLRERKPINKNYYNTTYWHPAILSTGLSRSRSNGTHALRHFCASTWLENGVSIRAVAEYLGHPDPGFTLRIYTHLMPKTDERARLVFELRRRQDSEENDHATHVQTRLESRGKLESVDVKEISV